MADRISNSLNDAIATQNTNIGTLSNLTTTAKTSLVAAVNEVNAKGIKTANVTVNSDANGNASFTGMPSAASANGYRNLIRFICEYTSNKLYYVMPYKIGNTYSWRLWEEYASSVATAKGVSNLAAVVYYYG